MDFNIIKLYRGGLENKNLIIKNKKNKKIIK